MTTHIHLCTAMQLTYLSNFSYMHWSIYACYAGDHFLPAVIMQLNIIINYYYNYYTP